MRCKFPYFEDRPHIPIQLEVKKKKLRFLPLLDTGADFSVFYKADAVRLDLDWKEGKKVEMDNADGTSFEAKQFKLEVTIEGVSFKADICFVDNERSAMPLLGRRDIFKHFKITIDEKNKLVEVKTNS